MSYIPTPSISTRIANSSKVKKHSSIRPVTKKVSPIEPVVETVKVEIDNKFRNRFMSTLFDTRQPNYTKQEIINILEKER